MKWSRNLAYDGTYAYAYDAWNRLIKVQKAFRDPTGYAYTLQLGSVVATMQYDGLGRRIVKAVTNSATLDATYHYYYNGQQMVETRNGSDLTIKQNVWGLTYIDELVQTSLNDDPADLTEQVCESNFYAMQDANYNVLGMTDEAGILVERYEYTPYGQRQVYTSSGLNDPQCYAPISTSKPWQIAGTPGIAQPYSLNETGHQGLFHDEEINLIYNRARYLKGQRYLQRDPLGYAAGSLSLYQYLRSNPVRRTDPSGLIDGEDMRPRPLPNNPTSPQGLGLEWITGLGPRSQEFGPDSLMVSDLQNHQGIADARNDAAAELGQNCQSCNSSASGTTRYSLAGLLGAGKYIRDASVIATGGVFGGNLSATYLGSYKVVWFASGSCCKGDGTVSFTVTNDSSAGSATRIPALGYQGRDSVQSIARRNREDVWGSIRHPIDHGIPSLWGKIRHPIDTINSQIPGQILDDNPLGPNGPLSTTKQTFQWEEKITFQKNESCNN